MSLTDLPPAALVAIGVLVAVQLTVDVIALVALVRTPVERLQLGARWPWVLIILLVNIVGGIVFLVAGRKPAPVPDPAQTHTARQSTGDAVRTAVDTLYPERPS